MNRVTASKPALSRVPKEQIRIERKLTAIFYADVVSYSRLTGEDEEGTHRRLSASLDAMTAAIETHGGRVVHFAGDAVLADFTSVSRALDCAVAVQLALKTRNAEFSVDQRLEFRIGLNLGDVMVDRGDIYGDGVNIAARLESLADPGGIAMSASVHHQVRRRTDLCFHFMGEQQVTNINDPVAAYRVVLDGKIPPPRRDPAAAVASPKHFFSPLNLIGGGLLAMLLAFIAVTAMKGAPEVPVERSPVIVVIPFRLIGDAQVDNIIRTGLMEDLMTSLSRHKNMRVVATSAPEEAVRAADYRLEGSVRQEGRGLRVTAQLIDTVSGISIWGRRYDRTVAALLAVQADVAEHIVTAMAKQLHKHEAERSEERGAAGFVPAGLEILVRMGEQVLSLAERLMHNMFGDKNTHGYVD
ncbi:MAG: adenylate/guanylate cyclase domain-containing protein [Rhodospirillales bacterium]|nr:adenylate/guanylate cyclase domain-containing protein [Rhodospirillales bacterium]